MKNIYGFFILVICIIYFTDTIAQTNFWEKINSPITGFSLDINKHGTIFLGTNYGIFYSPDNGINWSNVDSNLNSYCFAFNSNCDIISNIQEDSVFHLTDDGENWPKVYDQELIKTISINESGHIILG